LNASFIFIFIVVLLDVVALGIVIPVLPMLIEQMVGGSVASAAYWVGIFTTAWALMQFLCSPIMGALSDRYGRRPVVLISCFALAADYVLMALAPTLLWLFVGRILSGIFSANAVAAMAYIADVTKPEERAAKFGMLGAAWGLGFVLGPALGGWLGEFDLRLPFWVAGAVTLANAVYGVFVLPESLKPEHRAPFEWKKANPISALNMISQHAGLLRLSVVNLIYNVVHYIFPTVFALYTSHRYGWTPQKLGLTLALVGIFTVIVQGFLVRHVVNAVGEKKALWIACIGGTLGFILAGWSPTEMGFWLALPLLSLMGLFGPSVTALMSHKVPADAQGRLQGFNVSITGVAGLVGPAIFSATFAHAIANVSKYLVIGAPFYLAAAMMVWAMVLTFRSR
jgi:DHA1 family tetracycline resistance protein-like MFS transporter